MQTDRYFELNSTPLVGPTGQSQGTVVVCRDITERTKALRALADSEHLIRSLVENSSNGMLRFARDHSDANGKYRCTFANRAAEGFLHDGSNALVGMPLDKLGLLEPENLIERFSEARFGFRQALAQWPECETASDGLDQLLRAMIAIELDRGSVDQADALVDELSGRGVDVAPERERVAALTEIGEALGVSEPARMRIAHLVFYVSCDQRDELLDVREDLRDVADELDEVYSWGGSFDLHRFGRVNLYISPELSADGEGDHLIRYFQRAVSAADNDEAADANPLDRSSLSTNSDFGQ